MVVVYLLSNITIVTTILNIVVTSFNEQKNIYML